MKVSFKKQILLIVLAVVVLILFTSSISAVQVIPLGELNRPRNTSIYFHNISIYDSELKRIIDIHQGEHWFQHLTQSKKNSLPLYIQFPQFHVYDNKIFLKGLEKDFVINVFDASGRKLYSINHEYKKIKMTEADKKRYLDYFKTSRIFGKAYNQIEYE